LRGGGGHGGEADGGEVDAVEERVGLFGRQETGCDGLDDAVERAQDGGTIREGAEADCMGPESSQASAGSQLEVVVIMAVGKTGVREVSAGGSVGLGGGAKFVFHGFSSKS
jgi:hypothetical protein